MFRILVPVFLLISVLSHGQNADNGVFDTLKRIDPISTSQTLLVRNHFFGTRQDSSMLYFQQYDRNKKDAIAIQNLGDVHTPFINLQYKPFEQMGAVSGMNPYENLYFNPEQVKFYNARLPYTEFNYAQGKGGQRGMIDFDALHTQNFGKRFNVSALYHSTSNDGYYSRMSLSCKNLQVSAYYRSKNNRYTAMGIFLWNKTNFMENGGIEQTSETDSLFRLLPANVRLVNVSLKNARNINRYREQRLHQVYWLLMGPVKDSLQGASGLLGISHGFQFSKRSNYYTDIAGDFGFYDSVYFYNPEYSADSFALKQSSNFLEIFTPLRSQGLSFKAGLRYDQFTAFQSANSGNYHRINNHNHSVYAQFHFLLSERIHSEINGNYFYEGFNRNDFQLKWINRAFMGKRKQWMMQASFLSMSRKPMLRQNRLLSNHYRWENAFLNTVNQTVSLTIGKNSRRPSVYNAFYYTLPPKALEMELNYTLLDHYIYYNSLNQPAQGSKGQSIVQAVLKAHLNLRKLQFHQDLVLQTFSEQLKSRIQLPAVLSKSSLYFQTYAFKKAAFIQIGIDAFITSAYKAGLYNPALLNFRNSETNVGAYPYLDFFVNAEVKTIRIFFKVEHFNQDLVSNDLFPNYMFVSPYQPSAPRRFRLGFTWKFYY